MVDLDIIEGFIEQLRSGEMGFVRYDPSPKFPEARWVDVPSRHTDHFLEQMELSMTAISQELERYKRRELELAAIIDKLLVKYEGHGTYTLNGELWDTKEDKEKLYG